MSTAIMRTLRCSETVQQGMPHCKYPRKYVQEHTDGQRNGNELWARLFRQPDLDLEEGQTVEHLIKLAKLNSDDVAMVLVNGRTAGLDTVFSWSQAQCGFGGVKLL